MVRGGSCCVEEWEPDDEGHQSGAKSSAGHRASSGHWVARAELRGDGPVARGSGRERDPSPVVGRHAALSGQLMLLLLKVDPSRLGEWRLLTTGRRPTELQPLRGRGTAGFPRAESWAPVVAWSLRGGQNWSAGRRRGWCHHGPDQLPAGASWLSSFGGSSSSSEPGMLAPPSTTSSSLAPAAA